MTTSDQLTATGAPGGANPQVAATPDRPGAPPSGGGDRSSAPAPRAARPLAANARSPRPRDLALEGAQAAVEASKDGGPVSGSRQGAMRLTAVPAPALPQVVPGSLVRVRPDAESPYAGRSGLVLAVQGAVALLRFATARSYTFATSDLVPIVNVRTRRQQW